MNVQWLIENGPCKKYSAGEQIPVPGANPGDKKAVYILLSGAVDVYGKSAAGGIKKISSLLPGDAFCGREFFFGPGESTYKVSEDAEVYLLTEESFDELSWSQPGILFEILRSAYAPARKPSVNAPPAVKSLAERAQEAKAAKPAKAPPVTINPAVGNTAKDVTPPSIIEQNGIRVEFFLPGHKIYDKNFSLNEKLVYPKEYTCPLCKKPFTDFRIFHSKIIESGPMRFDFRKFYKDFIMEWYELITCHNCMFTAFHNYFTDPKPIKASAISDKLNIARAEVPIDFSAPRDVNHVFTMHYLALLCCDGFPSLAKQLYAKIWCNITWLYEDVEDEQLKKTAALTAAQAYEESYSQRNLTPAQEQMTCLSIAAMQHHAGKDSNLKKFLYLARTNKMGDKKYADLAEEFWNQLNLGELDPKEFEEAK